MTTQMTDVHHDRSDAAIEPDPHPSWRRDEVPLARVPEGHADEDDTEVARTSAVRGPNHVPVSF